jgi:hypothetical protein
LPLRLFQLALVGLLLVTVARAQTKPAPTPPPQTPPAAATSTIGSASHIRPPAPGYRFPEKLTYVYAVDWRLWSAGTASLHMESTGGQQKATGSAASLGFAAVLFTVRDRFESVFDPATFCSASLHKQTEEGARRRDTWIRFDYAAGKRLLDEKDLKTGKSKHTEAPIPGCMTDVLSGIYYLASLPLAVGSTYYFPLNDGGQSVDVKAHVEAREQIKTEAGTFQTLRVQPEAASGVLKDRGQVWIWYSDDAAHIPVQARARMFWGTLTIHLVRVERQ